VVVPCIWFEIRINYQLDAIEYLFTLARHISGLYAHLQEQWMLQFPLQMQHMESSKQVTRMNK